MAAQISAIPRDKLKFVKKIGIGGFSSVFQMTWKSDQGDIQVAAKRLNDKDNHELNIISSIDHPNIVKLLGVVDEEMDFMLILELCEGGSLRSYLDKHQDTHLSSNQFYDWAKQAAIPIGYLKKKQIVHKDIKSPNYMITADNNLKLGDFGLAKNIASTISNATKTASFPWMAPELFTLGKLSPNYDIFAFGVVLWELWTCEFPFKGLEPQVIAWRVCGKDAERLPIPVDMPQALADLMRQCWDTDWHKRPTIEHIISEINNAAAAAAVEAAAAKEARRQKIITGPWKLERRFGDQDGPGKLRYAWGMAVNTNGDIAIADYRAAQVKVFSSAGKYKYSLDTTKGLEPGTTSTPRQVTVNSKGNYYVTDETKYVKMYDVSVKFKGRWISSCPQASSHTPYLLGIAIDAKDEVLVGDARSMYINRHRQDGTHIASIKVGITPYYLAVTSQDTIIVGEFNKPPQIISHTGQVVCTLNHPVGNEYRWGTNGLHCWEDIIFIANFMTQEILCFSVTGEYVGRIPVNTNPKGISLVENGKKLIVSGSYEVFVYSLQM